MNTCLDAGVPGLFRQLNGVSAPAIIRNLDGCRHPLKIGQPIGLRRPAHSEVCILYIDCRPCSIGVRLGIKGKDLRRIALQQRGAQILCASGVKFKAVCSLVPFLRSDSRAAVSVLHAPSAHSALEILEVRQGFHRALGHETDRFKVAGIGSVAAMERLDAEVVGRVGSQSAEREGSAADRRFSRPFVTFRHLVLAGITRGAGRSGPLEFDALVSKFIHRQVRRLSEIGMGYEFEIIQIKPVIVGGIPDGDILGPGGKRLLVFLPIRASFGNGFSPCERSGVAGRGRVAHLESLGAGLPMVPVVERDVDRRIIRQCG